MTLWDEVKQALLDLEGAGALAQYPDPRGTEDRPPPFRIKLQPWATDAAADLHRRFGDDVDLVVGSLPYPLTAKPDRPTAVTSAAELAPDELRVELIGVREVRSGHHVTMQLRVHNLSAADIVVLTNGNLTAQVLDAATGERVGGYSGAQRLPLVKFTVPDSGSTVIPVLVGTASSSPELGYAVPPGEWAIAVEMKLDDGRTVRTPPMGVTVTA